MPDSPSNPAPGPARWSPGEPVLLAGPTASGKSATAVELARALDGEIVSVDSMQVYRGMDIGTAKPSRADREAVPHHLIDIADLHESFDAARFVRMATEACQAIRARGRTPILCGGTGLYFKAWLEGLGEAPPADPALREELAKLPLESLLRELAEKDPVTRTRIDAQNPRRVVRAVEVIRLTGRPVSAQQASWSRDAAITPGFFYLHREPAEALDRIHRRVDAMFAEGWVAETRRLRELGLERNPFAMQAIGYRLILEHLDGARDLEATRELVRIRTRQYARRQAIWFRRHGTAHWVQALPDESAPALAARLLQRLREPSVGAGAFPAR